MSLLASGIWASPAEALCTTKLQNINKDGDSFKNYDFHSRDAAPCNIDWPVNFLFWNSASVFKVKNDMESEGYTHTGSYQYGRVNDGGGGYWSPDQGRKNSTNCFLGDVEHFRLYAPSDGSLYNPSWGFYVIGTSHIDHNECFFGTWYGKSELAENRIAEDAVDEYGASRVEEDSRDMHNQHSMHQDGDHILDNNGYATRVKVP